MNLINACEDILDQLSDVIVKIKEEDYGKEIEILNGATVGQHIRHTLEFFMCLMQGFDLGIVDYDKRDHDRVIEKDKLIATAVISDIQSFLKKHTSDKDLTLMVNYSLSDHSIHTIATNYLRELAYNIEHAIHHMAIIKVGLREIADYVEIPYHFGIAISTIKHQKTLTGKP